MDTATTARYVKALRSIEDKLRKLQHLHDVDTDEGKGFAVLQVNRIREALAAEDPMVGMLFPEVPAGANYGEIAVIAGQLADFVTPEPAEAPSAAAAEGAQTGQPSVGAINVEIGDGAIVGMSGIEHIGEVVRNAIARAVEEVGDVAKKAGGVASDVVKRFGSPAGAGEGSGEAGHEGEKPCGLTDAELDAKIAEAQAKLDAVIARDAALAASEAKAASVLVRELARLKAAKLRREMAAQTERLKQAMRNG